MEGSKSRACKRSRTAQRHMRRTMPRTAASGLVRLTLKNLPFNSNGGYSSGSGRVSVGMKACEKIPPTAAGAPKRAWPRGGSPNIWSCRARYTPRYWDSRALPNTPMSTLASREDYFTSSEGRNWLEREVKPRKIQPRVTEFSTVSQRSG
jgi:hypothetical protein